MTNKLNSIASLVLGQTSEDDTPDKKPEDAPILDQNIQAHHRIVGDAHVTSYTSPHLKGTFKQGDFQIGSVILPVGPNSLQVNRLRNVHTTPVLRGASIPTRQGIGVTTITLSVDIPDYTSVDGSVTPLTALIAEFKLSPFTVLRNRDLSSKVSQAVISGTSKTILSAISNIRDFDIERSRLKKWFTPFFNTKGDNNKDVGKFRWQDELRLELNSFVTDLKRNPDNYKKDQAASNLISKVKGIIPVDGTKSVDHNLPTPNEIYGKERWTSLVKQLSNNEWISDVTASIEKLITVMERQAKLNEQSRKEGAEKITKPPIYVPVVLTRMVFNTVPGSPRSASVTFYFELFNYTSYVDKLEWHHFNGVRWTGTENPAEADLLLRWRDKQFIDGNTSHLGYVDMSRIDEESLNKNIETLVLNKNTGIPGYFKYLRGAWRNRRSMSPSSKAADHKLEILYPHNVPQITNSSAQGSGSYYKSLVVDDGTGSTGLTKNISVVWDLGVARQMDEFTGNVTHQFVGGSKLDVNFEICVPTPTNPSEGEERTAHEGLLGEVNRMFDAIEQNRRILPSEMFQPTTVFVNNPITRMFGAYVFEAGDMPIVQQGPGHATVNIRVSEAIPVVGLGDITQEIKADTIDRASIGKVLIGVWLYYLTNGKGTYDIIQAMNMRVGMDQYPKVALTYTVDSTRKARDDTPHLYRRLVSYLIDRGQWPYDSESYFVWSKGELLSLMGTWSRLVDKHSARFGIPVQNSMGEGVRMLSQRMLNLVILNYLSGKQAFTYPYAPAGIAVDAFQSLHSYLQGLPNSDSAFGRYENVSGILSIGSVPEDNAKDLLRHIDIKDTENIEKFLSKEGLYVGNFAQYIAINSNIADSLDAQTFMLYPDMVLPTIRTVLGISASSVTKDIPSDTLAYFVPTFSEQGNVTDPSVQFNAGRTIDDLADPDIWFRRNIPAILTTAGVEVDRKETDVTIEKGGKSPPTDNISAPVPVAESTSKQLADIADMANMEVKDVLGAIDVDLLAKPNRRRMLYAYPTFAMEFILDGTHAKNIISSSAPAQHWEARLLNILPINKIETVLNDTRPSTTNIEFVSRRAALRNESWQWLDPIVPISNKTFTNNIEEVQALMSEHLPVDSDPTLLAQVLLGTGSRVSIRMGYGVDLNNDEMLPIVLAGVIGEISLGEISRMVVHDIGIQLANPIDTTIGGTGNYSPNRIWSGAFTLRAFTDIFRELDTKYMGKSGRGTESDLVDLTDEEIQNIYAIGVITRNTTENFQSVVGKLRETYYNNIGKPVADGINSVLGYFGMSSRVAASNSKITTLSNILDTQAGNFFPEMLNVHPTATGTSDWAISNSKTKGLQATYWIDMISRLNPGTCWWSHPYGNEARLFFGQPEQYYRKYPFTQDGALVSAAIGLIRSEFSKEVATAKATAKQVAIKGIDLYETDDSGFGPIGSFTYRSDVTGLITRFEDTVGIDAADEYLREILIAISATNISQTTGGSTVPEVLTEIDKGYEKIADRDGISSQSAQGFNMIMRAKNKVIEGHAGTRSDFEYAINTYLYLNNSFNSNTYARDFSSLSKSFALYLKNVSSADSLENAPNLPNTNSGEWFFNMISPLGDILDRLLNDKEFSSRAKSIHKASLPLTRAKHRLGYRRFRQYHQVMSGQELLSNGLIASQGKMANAVQADGYTIGYDVLPFERRVTSIEQDVGNLNFGIFQWFKGIIGENDRDRVLGRLIPNALARGMARMYDGIVELRGNPSIKPHDVLYMLDLHNGIYGPVRCSSVIHSLTPEQGYVTRVVPQAHTQAFSSRVLTEHIAQQRVMKTIAHGSIIAGIGLAAFGGAPGVLAGVGVVTIGAALSSFADMADTIGRRKLTSYNPGEALRLANESDDVDQAIKMLIVDTYVSNRHIDDVRVSIKDHAIKDISKFVKGMSDHKSPQLGVTFMPLTRLGTYQPIIAGLKNAGLVTVDDSLTTVASEGANVATKAIGELFSFSALIDFVKDETTNFGQGWDALNNTIDLYINNKKATRAALKARGVKLK